ncbi:MAG: site-specific integrase [Gammaproteobacteria bacterium]|nr:site-specific integrase [Gammaproteobacteria bacterium]
MVHCCTECLKSRFLVYFCQNRHFYRKGYFIANIVPLHPAETSEIAISVPHHYIHAATSANTRKAYQADIRHFLQSLRVLPATTESILDYLHAYATTLNPRTLTRRLTALKQWHILQGHPDPDIPIR